MPVAIPDADVIVIALKDYLLRELLEDEECEVGADDNLIAEGLIERNGGSAEGLQPDHKQRSER